MSTLSSPEEPPAKKAAKAVGGAVAPRSKNDVGPEGGSSGVSAAGAASATCQGEATCADPGAEVRVRMLKTELEKCLAQSDYVGAVVLQKQNE